MSADNAAISTFDTPQAVGEFLIVSMAVTYGAPEDCDRSMPWHLVGTDAARLDLFEQVEGFADISLTDEQRESVRTLGDLIDLAVKPEAD